MAVRMSRIRQPIALSAGLANHLTKRHFLPIQRHASTKGQALPNSSRLAYRPVKSNKISVLSTETEQQARIKLMRKQTLYIGGGLLVLFGSMWAFFSFVKADPPIPQISPGQDVSDRYEHIAVDFDKCVGRTEFWWGINRLRKKLLKQASGNVLEVSVGTGRNSNYYQEGQCQSITMVDQSKEMVDIARKAFKAAHPKYKHHKFIVQSALEPIAAPPEGFDTIVQTMGLCSTPHPVGLLKCMEAVLKPGTGRILLLEHGRGYYDWINSRLDKHATPHAHKFGCWWNKDIEKIIEDSGLEVVVLKRHHFGTTWWVELKSKRPPAK